MRRLSVVLSAGFLATACVGGSTDDEMDVEPSDRLPKVEIWHPQTGWLELPPASVEEPRERWRVPARTDDLGAFTIEGGVLVTLASEGTGHTVHRIDPADGRTLWSVPVTGLAAGPTVEISVDRSLVAVASESMTAPTVVMDAADGRVVWQGVTEEYTAKAEATDDLVLVDTSTGTVAVDRATGAARWEVPHIVTVSGAHLVSTDFEGSKRHYSLLDPATGTPVWTTTAEGSTAVDVVEETFLITTDVEDTSRDTVAAYDLATGKPRWQKDIDDLGRPFVTSVYENTAVFAGTTEAVSETAVGVVVIDLATGEVEWESDTPVLSYTGTRSIRVDGDPYVLTEQGDMIEVRDGRTGDVTGSIPTTIGRTSQLAGGALYRGDVDGVRAFQFPELTGQWQTTTPVEGGVIEGVIPGGFVVTEFTDGVGDLVGYVG